MDSATNMSDEELTHEEKIILYTGCALTVLGIGGSLFILPLVWAKPIICALILSWYLFAFTFPCRMWTFEKLDLTGEPGDPELQTFEEFHAMLRMKLKGVFDENISDWEDLEDASNSSETFGIDTPSETGQSDSSSIPMSTDSISVDWTESSRASARDAIDTAFISDDAASSLDTPGQLFARRDTPGNHTKSQGYPAFARRGQTTKATDTAATIIQQSEPPKSTPENPIETLAMRLKQPLKSESLKNLHLPRSKLASGHQSMPTFYMFEKAKRQPTDVTVLYIVKGIEYEERMLVRMYKTTPFILLKNELREKNDTISELAIRDHEGGEFPVFDYDTPLSIGLNPLNILFWRPMPSLPTALDLTGKDRSKDRLASGQC